MSGAMPQGLEEAQRIIRDLLHQNNSLKQDNHNVKEEIFDLKMCMATTQVESTALLQKEMDSLKSEMSFKEREIQELLRESSQNKRKYEEITQKEKSTNGGNSSKRQQVSSSEQQSNCKHMEATSMAATTVPTPSTFSSQAFEERIGQEKEKMEKSYLKQRRRAEESHRQQNSREKTLSWQKQTLQEYLLEFVDDLTNASLRMSTLVQSLCQHYHHNGMKKAEKGKTINSQVSEINQIISTSASSASPSLKKDLTASSTNHMRIVSAVRSPSRRRQHKYFTSVPMSIEDTSAPAPSLLPHSPIVNAAEAKVVRDTFEEFLKCCRAITHAVRVDHLFLSKNVPMTTNWTRTTHVDRILSSLMRFVQCLIDSTPSSVSNDLSETSIGTLLSSALEVLHRTLSCFHFAPPPPEVSPLKETKDRSSDEPWRRYIPNSDLLHQESDVASSSREEVQSLNDCLRGITSSAVVSTSELRLISLTSAFNNDVVDPLWQVFDFAVSNQLVDSIEFVSKIVTKMLRLGCGVVSSQYRHDHGEEGDDHECRGCGVDRNIARALQLLFGGLRSSACHTRAEEKDNDEAVAGQNCVGLVMTLLLLNKPKTIKEGDMNKAKGFHVDHDSDHTSVELLQSRWQLKVLSLPLRRELLLAFHDLLGVCEAVFTSFYDAQRHLCTEVHDSNSSTAVSPRGVKGMVLSPETNPKTLTTNLKGVATLPLPPSLDKRHVGEKEAVAMLKVSPLSCQLLIHLVHQLTIAIGTCNYNIGEEDASTLIGVTLTCREIDHFCVTLLEFIASILLRYKHKGAQCVLGFGIYATGSAVSGSRKQLLASFGKRNSAALMVMKRVVHACWGNVLSMDDAPVPPHPNNTEDARRTRDGVASAYIIRASAITTCTSIMKHIHALLCTPQGDDDLRTVVPSLADIMKMSGCSDIFANLLFRVYKNRVHNWIDTNAFEDVMDIYDDGSNSK